MTDIRQDQVLDRAAPETEPAGRSFAGGHTQPVTPDRMSRLVTMTLVAQLIPVFFSLGGLLMSPARLLLLVLVPILLVQLLNGRYGRITIIDSLVFLNLFWFVLAVCIDTPSQAVTFAGSNIMLMLGGYLVGRCMIRTPAHFEGLSRLFLTLVLISLPFAIYETITAHTIITELIDKIPGIYSYMNVNYPRRLSLARVQFVFVHPIHYGLFCSLALSLCYVGLSRSIPVIRRFIYSGLVLLATFLSVSSGPFLAAMTQIFLILWLLVMAKVPGKWRVLGAIVTVLYVVAEIIATRPAIYVLVSMLAFDPATANWRRIILDYGLAQVMRTPFLGIGPGTYFPMPFFMSGSVDNYWLLIALVYGVPALMFLWAAMLVIFKRMAGVRNGGPLFERQRLAWVFTMISMILSLTTVAIWGELLTIFYFFLGSGVWMAGYVPPAAEEAAASAGPEPIRSGLVYSRFVPHPVHRNQNQSRDQR